VNATLISCSLSAPTTYAATSFVSYLQLRQMPEDPDDGSAGVREPRRPAPFTPVMSMAL
jgi:hypothetical protein